jgi:hypothetical protein
MNNLSLTVRLFMCGEYENTLTACIEIPDDTEEENMMNVMMEALHPEMENMYGDYSEWEDGEISWVLDDWEIVE